MSNRDRTFDWVSRHDPRSKSYPVRAALPRDLPERQVWTPGAVTDQGAEGACVGHAWTAELLAEPAAVRLPSAGLPSAWPTDPETFAGHLYRQAQRVDEWPGEDYEGSSVLAGAKVTNTLGLIGSYRWAFGVDDVVDAIRGVGPVVLGIPWLTGMYEPSGPWLRPSGSVAGGHAILACGYDARAAYSGSPSPMVMLRNSWGPDWGVNGCAWIRVRDLAALLREDGEACVPMVRHAVAPGSRFRWWGRLRRWWRP